MNFGSIEGLSEEDILNYYSEIIEGTGNTIGGCRLEEYSWCYGCVDGTGWRTSGYAYNGGYCSVAVYTYGDGEYCYVHIHGGNAFYCRGCKLCR